MFKNKIFVLFLFMYIDCLSQNQSIEISKNSSVFSVGTSASIFSKLSFIDTSGYTFRNQTLPALNVGYDFASNSNFTFGVTMLVENFEFYKVDSNGTIFLNKQGKLASRGSFSKKYTNFLRINPGVRILYHYIKGQNDFYGGSRMGYELFINNSKSFIYYKKLIPKISFQFLIGYRLFVNKWGFNTEIAVGRPYWFYAGVNYKFID